jgi:hypothetical protein
VRQGCGRHSWRLHGISQDARRDLTGIAGFRISAGLPRVEVPARNTSGKELQEEHRRARAPRVHTPNTGPAHGGTNRQEARASNKLQQSAAACGALFWAKFCPSRRSLFLARPPLFFYISTTLWISMPMLLG